MNPKVWKWLAIAFFAWNLGYFAVLQGWRAWQWKTAVERSLIRLDQFIAQAHPELVRTVQRPSVDMPIEKRDGEKEAPPQEK